MNPTKVMIHSKLCDLDSPAYISVSSMPDSVTVGGVRYTFWQKMRIEETACQAILPMAMGEDGRVYSISYRVNADVDEEAGEIDDDAEYISFLCTGVDFAHPCRITRIPRDPVHVADDVDEIVYEDHSPAAWQPGRKDAGHDHV